MGSLIPIEVIERKIFEIRGKRIMLDSDLAELYGVETRSLVRLSNVILNDFHLTFCSSLAKRSLIL